LTLCVVFASKISQDVLTGIKQRRDGKISVLVSFPKLDLEILGDLQEMEWGPRGRVVFEALRTHAEQSQASVQSLLRQKGVNYNSLFISNVLSLDNVDISLVKLLAERDDVESISSNEPGQYKLHLPKIESLPSAQTGPTETEWNIDFMNATACWKDGVNGKGITIGFADTGQAYQHPALVDHYRGNHNGKFSHEYNWWDAIKTGQGTPGCPHNSTHPCDDYNPAHGSHCAGIATGGTKDYHIGVAPGAKWIGCRVFARSGSASAAGFLSCFQYFLAPTDFAGGNPKPEMRPDVTSHSYYCGSCNAELIQRAVDALYKAGTVVVVAAGNSGPRCKSIGSTWSPQIQKGNVLVGAGGFKSTTIASFSSRGSLTVGGQTRIAPNIVTPGQNIKSSVTPDKYQVLSGTSMACPGTAGAFALIWSGVPKLKGNIEKTLEILQETADHKETNECADSGMKPTPNNVYGHGNVDVYKALLKAKELYSN
jgi:subtilisin family serine protease